MNEKVLVILESDDGEQMKGKIKEGMNYFRIIGDMRKNNENGI